MQGSIKLDFQVSLVVGNPVAVTVVDSAGRNGSAQGPVVEAARTKAVTAEEVAEHVGRLGGTPYAVGSWSLDLSPSAGIGFSVLHRARRDALEAYEAVLLAPWSGRHALGATPPPSTRARRTQVPLRLAVRVADAEVARACLDAGADEAQVPALSLAHGRELAAGIVPVLPRIAHDREVAVLLRRAVPGARLVVGNLGLVRAAADLGSDVEADWSLNALNTQSVEQLAELGARVVWLSPELSGQQLADVAGEAAVEVGIGVYGRQELMVTEHCILMAEGPCEQNCAVCSRRASVRTLRDRKGFEFPVITDLSGRSHLYNSVPLDLSSAIPEIATGGVSAIRLDLELEDAQTAAKQTRRFRELLQRADLGIAPPARERDSGTTSGHYFRGVL